MSTRPEIHFQNGLGQNLIDFSALPGYSAGIPPFSQYAAVSAEALADIVDSSNSCRNQDLWMLTRQLREGIYVPELAEAYAVDLTSLTTPRRPLSIHHRLRNAVGSAVKGIAAAVLLFAATEGLIGQLDNGKVVAQTDPCAGYTKIANDMYGPEESLACLESRYPIEIGAVDYSRDADGNVTKEKMVVAADQGLSQPHDYYESTKDPVSGNFSKGFQFRYQIPMNNVTAMASSSSDSFQLFGGSAEGVAFLTLTGTFDQGKTFQNTNSPFPGVNAEGIADLVRLTDSKYLGNAISSDGTRIYGGLFTLSVNPDNKQISSPQLVSPDLGKVNNLLVTSVYTPTHTADFIAAGSYNYQNGLLVGSLDYENNTVTFEHITTATFNGTSYYLGQLSEAKLYKDTQNRRHVKTSGFMDQILYDINIDTPAKEATWLNYANLCDNKLPDYINGSLRIGPIDVYTDAQGNLHTWLGGGGNKIGWNGVSYAVIVELESDSCAVLTPDVPSGVLNIQREKFNGQMVEEAIIERTGKASKLGADPVIFTTRGLGIKPVVPTPTPTVTPKPTLTPVMRPRVYLPIVTKP